MILIRLHKNKVYFNKELFIPAASTNLPVSEIDFSLVEDVYWEIEQEKYDKTDEALTVKVCNYFSLEKEVFEQQKPRRSISRLYFDNLWDAENLKRCLIQYPHITGKRATTSMREHIVPDDSLIAKPKGPALFKSKPETTELIKEFEIDWKDAEIRLGYITFETYIADLREHIEFKIQNDYLLPEFDLIKFYFSKALKSRKFDVKARIVVKEGKATETHATSRMISWIDASIIESVKSFRIKLLTRPPAGINTDKSLFTSDDIFDAVDQEGRGNVFNQSELDLLNSLLEKYNVRNKKQLQFLSGFLQAPAAKLRFTLHPYFGFLFSISGERMNHYVWELLNTHATYIWSFDKGEQELWLQYRRVEDAINQVRSSGRDSYKLAFVRSHLDSDLLFSTIRHEDAGSEFIDGFVKWRHRLEELLV